MQDGSPAPGLSNITAEGWFPHGGLPILMTMVAVNFAFSGTELIGIAAGETENPRKVIPVAIRTTIARLIIFFIGTVFVLAALIPMQQAGVEKSPFVLVFEKVGIPYAADIFNFVILTAILSAANSGLYASGRMLWSLSNERTLPACFARVTKNGVPLTALSVSMLGGVLALFSSVVAPDTVFVALSAISGFAVVAVWLSICASHFVFRRRHLQVHVEEDSRRAEYGTLPGSLSEEATNSGFPTGSLQRRGKPELPLPGPQNGRNGDGNADTA